MQNAARTRAAVSADEMPIRLLYLAVGGAALLLTFIAVNSAATVGLGLGILMALLGTRGSGLPA
jgi:hypothetical protein